MQSSSLVLLSILFLSFPVSFSQKLDALVAPVTKDPSTLQYIAKVHQRTPLVPLNLVVDLSGRYLWVDCDKGYVSSTYRPVQCTSAACSAANSFSCSNCFSKRRPGCNNNTCGVATENPFLRTSTTGELATDVFAMPSTDGMTSGPLVSYPNIVFSCVPSTNLHGLAHGTTGVIGLGHSNLTPPQQLAESFGFQHTFAICLSSMGFMYYGKFPYLVNPSNDLSKSLLYTPLLVNPSSSTGTSVKGEKSSEYFISLRSIKIDGQPIKLNKTLLKFNNKGIGGTKLSTVHPYTLLERSIFEAVLGAFKAAISHYGLSSGVKLVDPVAPFGLCFDANSIDSGRLGPIVPTIDLVLQNNSVVWSLFGHNSMVAVGNDTLCLGFVDGGMNPTTSIVIGGYQLEDNLLLFDLARSRLGFSTSSLLSWPYMTFCTNFKYTT